MLDRMLAIIAPHTCLGCDVEPNLLCDDCGQNLGFIEPQCIHCGHLDANFSTCANFKNTTGLDALMVRTDYVGPARQLVAKLKFNYAKSSAKDIAGQLSSFARPLNNDVVVTHIPTVSRHLRQRGYDHAKLIARHYSANVKLKHKTLLTRQNNNVQVGSTRSVRLKQQSQAFRVTGDTPKTIILIDDVVTTGATLASATKALKSAGAKDVRALVFARA